MKKIIALLCALLLLSVSCASAAGTVVEFHDKLLLNGTLPDGYSYTQISLDDSTLFGEVTSGNSAGAHLEICISLSDNSSYIVAESPKDLSADELNLIKTDIINYTEEMRAKWLSQGGVEAEWDDYLARLNSMGLDTYMAIYQKNYTATHSN